MLALLIFSDNISNVDFRILEEKNANAQLTRLPAPAQQSMQQAQRGAGMMTAPIMAYLSNEPYEVRQAVLGQVFDMARDLGPDVFEDQSRALQRRPDYQATLRKAKTPTLILCGAHDKLTPVKRHEFMAELMPHARLTVLENAGHILTLEDPEAVNIALRDWLAVVLEPAA